MITAARLLISGSIPSYFQFHTSPRSKICALVAGAQGRRHATLAPNLSYNSLSCALFSSSSSSPSSAPHTKSYKIQGMTNSNSKSGVTVRTNTGHVISTDVPVAMGGKNAAPQPVELLLAALIGCTQATALYVGRHMQPRLVLDKLEFDLLAERDERGALSHVPILIPATNDANALGSVLPEVPSRLQRVSGTIRVYRAKGMPIAQHVLEILSLQTEARCPVANMMHASGTIVDFKWIDGSIGS